MNETPIQNWLPAREQRDIVAAVGDALIDILPLSRLHAPGQSDRDLLPALAELGVVAMSLDESRGGAGLGPVEEALLFERLGRQLASPTVLASVLAAHVTTDVEVASRLAEGRASATLAVAFDQADPDDDRLLLIDAGLTPGPVVRIQASRARIAIDANLIYRRPLDARPWALPLEEARTSPSATWTSAPPLRAALLCAAQLSGLAAAARDMAVDYAKIREQFGKPIGSFQAIKHHCADMATGALAASDLTAFAAIAVAEGRPDAAFQVQSALSVAARAARSNAGANIQIHGGMGFSDECDAHLILKHAHVWDRIAGGSATVATLLLAEHSPLPATRSRH